MKHSSRTTRHQRIRARVKGTSARPRANVYRSLSRIWVQVIDDVSGKTLVSAYGTMKKGQDKMSQAKVVGTEVAKAALAKGIKAIVFDRGGYRYHGRVKAVADAMREAGLEF